MKRSVRIALLVFAGAFFALRALAGEVPPLKDLRKPVTKPPAAARAEEQREGSQEEAEETAAVPIRRYAPGEVPPLADLRKPVEKKPEVELEAQPVTPMPVGESSRIADPARLCPEDAVWYITVPDAARLLEHWQDSPGGALMAEPAMAQTIRNNRFGLDVLFSDLPEFVITQARVGAVASTFELSNALAKLSDKVSMAAYIDAAGNFNFLMVIDVGLDRTAAFETIGEWETYFFLTHPGSDVARGDHSGNYLDVWQLKNEPGDAVFSEVTAGFIENMAIVSNSAELASAAAALAGGGASVAESRWGRRLAASQAASSTADAVAYLRMDALIKGLDSSPVAKGSVIAWADFLGHGGREGEAMYYGLEFTTDGSRETLLLPVSGQSLSASLIEVLAKRLRPVDKWTTTSVIPYQPNPSMFFGALIEGRQLGGMLRQERRLFGSGAGPGDPFAIPPETRQLFTNDLLPLLTGEMGLAFFPSPESETGTAWLLVLPCTDSPERFINRAVNTIERSGATIYSVERDYATSASWAAATSARFRRLTGNYLLIASEGRLILSAIDNIVSGTSFANNKDFSQVIAKSEDGQGMLLYINTPEVLLRHYPNLPALMRALYPRSSGLNSRPPLAMLRRYAKGIMATIAPIAEGEEFTRLTVQAPLPTMGAISASVVLSFPRSLREDGRQAMAQSRENLQNIWLRLQLYASRFGHFPESLEDLAADMRSPDISNDVIRALFTAPAAQARIGPAAADRSYRFLSGVTPNDEPDIPIVYEAQPWSEDFTDWYPRRGGSQSQSESGDYVPFRQYIRLDGQVVVMPEKRFQELVQNRLRERE